MAFTFCQAVTDITLGCSGNTGGLNAFYIIPYAAVSAFTANSQGVITAMTLANQTTFAEYEFRRGNASFAESSPSDVTKGNVAYSYDISLTLTRREAAKRTALLLATQGLPPLAIVVKDSNGEFHAFFNADDATYLTNQAGGIEATKDGANNYVLTFNYQSNIPPYFITPALMNSLI
jgi:hypothetical protein